MLVGWNWKSTFDGENIYIHTKIKLTVKRKRKLHDEANKNCNELSNTPRQAYKNNWKESLIEARLDGEAGNSLMCLRLRPIHQPWRWAFWKCNHFHANKIREAFHFGEVVKAPINNNSQAIWEFCCFHSITLPSIARLGRRCNESFFNCTIFASPLTCEHSSNTHFSGCWNFSHCFTWNGFLCSLERKRILRQDVNYGLKSLSFEFFFHHPSEVHKLIHDGT